MGVYSTFANSGHFAPHGSFSLRALFLMGRSDSAFGAAVPVPGSFAKFLAVFRPTLVNQKITTVAP